VAQVRPRLAECSGHLPERLFPKLACNSHEPILVSLPHLQIYSDCRQISLLRSTHDKGVWRSQKLGFRIRRTLDSIRKQLSRPRAVCKQANDERHWFHDGRKFFEWDGSAIGPGVLWFFKPGQIFASLEILFTSTHPRNGYNRYQIIPRSAALAGSEIEGRVERPIGAHFDPLIVWE
jgi:hypothetical protein